LIIVWETLHLQKLLEALQDILPQHPLGIGEYDLLQVLQQAPYKLFSGVALADPLVLFQTHFMLFHALYVLKDKWLQEQNAMLDILVTHIRYLPYESGQEGLAKEDKLRAYYLDWQNFSATDKQDVERLIESFWKLMSGVDMQTQQDPETVRLAYQSLHLPQDADFYAVKRQYHRLQHQYHPDKGGETAKAQEIERAFSVLKMYLKQN
jgi:hypothetical protein